MPDARVTAVLSLLSLLFTVGLALYDRRKQKKGLIRTTPTSRLPDGLHLLGSQNGESSVHNLWCVVLTLLSAGSDPIRPQDFVDGYLRFSFKDNAQIKDLTEGDSKPRGIRVSVSGHGADGFELQPFFLNPGNEVSVCALVQHHKAPELSEPIGRIDGVPSLREQRPLGTIVLTPLVQGSAFFAILAMASLVYLVIQCETTH